MAKILAFAGSNSSSSINHQLLKYIQSNYLPEMKLVELRSFEVPMYSMDTELNSGIPLTVQKLHVEIKHADLLLLSTSEHNGSYTSYFKSTMDWLSRFDRDFVKEKPVFIAGTSPGRGGASNSIELSKRLMERLGATVKQTFSLPSFGHVFENGKLIEEHESRLADFITTVKS
ncbi:NAD(P)H-dependent oxidoreductase [Fluviicola sp. SGL-29]|nr:NAD(P)H-dependent oxidoreductase [Fluviicola sp. SGL-29]